MIRKLLIASACSVALALGGCATIENGWNSLTGAQKVALTTTIVNGVCVAIAAGAQVAAVDNAILNPNYASGGAGSSAAGTITKVSQLTAANCQAINGAIVAIAQATAVPAQ